jgi:hypothetical protein
VNRTSITASIYLSAAAATPLLWMSRRSEDAAVSPMSLPYRVLLAGIPLFFVFVYSRSLLAANQSRSFLLWCIGLVHAALAILVVFLFASYARRIHEVDLDERIGWMVLAFVLVVFTAFFVSALSLTFRGRSSLATPFSFLLWPCWLVIAFPFVDRYFNDDFLAASLCFICFLTAVNFAFAAGALQYYPKTAHIAALAGIAALPWIYTSVLRGNIYGNEWIIFNVPDRELRFYNGLATARLAIIAVALIIFAIATAILRLLPGRWGQRTWPAAIVSLCFIAVWFSQSVMPYRIPGAVDYGSWPILQVLRVEKRGLQFHETCVKVWGRRGMPESVTIVWNDRRLLEYRFEVRSGRVEVTQSLWPSVMSVIQSGKAVKSNRGPIKPLRRWDDEGWYVTGEEVGFQAYTKENQSTPPQEVVNLFDELEKLPRTQVTSGDSKDVCLGFCYDQLSALGALYANHRCRYEEASRDYVCR